MLLWMRAVVVSLFLMVGVFSSAQGTFIINNITNGGEIPWPLSNQHVVNIDNSPGLWQLENTAVSKIFNVEMIIQENGMEWIRVAELDPKTYEVLSWGEGIFANDLGKGSSGSSYGDIKLDSGKKPDDSLGRYLVMFPNGNLGAESYLLRLVEVETALGPVLGMSIINYLEKNFEHMLGTRVLKEPLMCSEPTAAKIRLNCFFKEIQ